MADKMLNAFDVWITAQGVKSRTRLRSVDNISLEGVERLRELILELAIRGRLVDQDNLDEPAEKLIKTIKLEKEKLFKEGRIKKILPENEINENEIPYKLPKGWVWTRNSFLFALRKGKKPKTISNENIGVPYLDIAALDRGEIDKFTDDLTCPTATEDDILVVCDGSRSGLLLNGKNGVVGSTLSVVDTVPFLKDYLRILFAKAFNELNSTMKGAAIPHLDTNKLLNSPVALPPLAEQHRIVAKVDELMALCDELEQQETHHLKSHQLLVETLLGTLTRAADANEFQHAWKKLYEHFDDLFTTEDSIDQLKQTILQLAVMGKLVPQDPNDEPASELLKRIAKEKERLVSEGKIKRQKDFLEIGENDKPFESPKNWEWCRLQSLVYLLGDGLHGTPNYTPDTNYYFVNGNNLRNGKIVIDSGTKTVSREEMLKHRKELTLNSVLVSINGTLGNIAFYNGEEIMLGKSACYFNLSPKISKHFVRKLIESKYFMEYATTNATGTTIKNLGLKAMNELPICLPPLAEQNRIVAKVDELFALCDRLKERIAEAQRVKNQMAEGVVV